MGRGILGRSQAPTPEVEAPPVCTQEPGARASPAPTPRKVRAGAHLHPFQRPPPPAPPRRRHPTFHGDGGVAPPAWELRAAGKVRAEQRSLRAHGSRAARRPSAPEPSPAAGRAPRSALCAAGPPRAAHPGREAPHPPAPLPLARRGAPAPAPRPPRARPRPPRPRACSRSCLVPFSPRLGSPSLSRVLFPVGPPAERSLLGRLGFPLGVRGRCCSRAHC